MPLMTAGIFGWTAEKIGDTIGSTIISVLQFLIGGITEILAQILASIAHIVLKAVAFITPDRISSYLGAAGGVEFNRVITTISISVTILIALLEIVKGLSLLGVNGDTPTRPITIVIRTFCAGMLIYSIFNIANMLFAKMNEEFTKDISSALNHGNLQDSLLGDDGFLSTLSSAISLDFTMSNDWRGELAALLLTAVIFILIVFNFLRLLFEMTVKIGVLIIYIYWAPFTVAFLPSSSLSQITFNWVKTFISTLLMWLMNAWLVVSSLQIINSPPVLVAGEAVSALEYLAWVFFAYGFIKAALQIENIINTLGGNVVKTPGGFLRDSLQIMSLWSSANRALSKNTRNAPNSNSNPNINSRLAAGMEGMSDYAQNATPLRTMQDVKNAAQGKSGFAKVGAEAAAMGRVLGDKAKYTMGSAKAYAHGWNHAQGKIDNDTRKSRIADAQRTMAEGRQRGQNISRSSSAYQYRTAAQMQFDNAKAQQSRTAQAANEAYNNRKNDPQINEMAEALQKNPEAAKAIDAFSTAKQNYPENSHKYKTAEANAQKALEKIGNEKLFDGSKENLDKALTAQEGNRAIADYQNASDDMFQAEQELNKADAQMEQYRDELTNNDALNHQIEEQMMPGTNKSIKDNGYSVVASHIGKNGSITADVAKFDENGNVMGMKKITFNDAAQNKGIVNGVYGGRSKTSRKMDNGMHAGKPNMPGVQMHDNGFSIEGNSLSPKVTAEKGGKTYACTAMGTTDDKLNPLFKVSEVGENGKPIPGTSKLYAGANSDTTASQVMSDIMSGNYKNVQTRKDPTTGEKVPITQNMHEQPPQAAKGMEPIVSESGKAIELNGQSIGLRGADGKNTKFEFSAEKSPDGMYRVVATEKGSSRPAATFPMSEDRVKEMQATGGKSLRPADIQDVPKYPSAPVNGANNKPITTTAGKIGISGDNLPADTPMTISSQMMENGHHFVSATRVGDTAPTTSFAMAAKDYKNMRDSNGETLSSSVVAKGQRELSAKDNTFRDASGSPISANGRDVGLTGSDSDAIVTFTSQRMNNGNYAVSASKDGESKPFETKVLSPGEYDNMRANLGVNAGDAFAKVGSGSVQTTMGETVNTDNRTASPNTNVPNNVPGNESQSTASNGTSTNTKPQENGSQQAGKSEHSATSYYPNYGEKVSNKDGDAVYAPRSSFGYSDSSDVNNGYHVNARKFANSDSYLVTASSGDNGVPTSMFMATGEQMQNIRNQGGTAITPEMVSQGTVSMIENGTILKNADGHMVQMDAGQLGIQGVEAQEKVGFTVQSLEGGGSVVSAFKVSDNTPVASTVTVDMTKMTNDITASMEAAFKNVAIQTPSMETHSKSGAQDFKVNKPFSPEEIQHKNEIEDLDKEQGEMKKQLRRNGSSVSQEKKNRDLKKN